MGSTTLGDMAQYYVGRRNTVAIKTRLNTLTEELSTGQVKDVSRNLRGDTRLLTATDRELGLNSAYSTAATELSQRLAVMQTSLEQVETARSETATELVTITSSSSQTERDAAVTAARNGLTSVLDVLNVSVAGGTLFGGAASDTNVMADAEFILSGISGAIAGIPDAATAETAVDDWLDANFATNVYLGASQPLSRRVDEGQSIDIPVTGSDPAFREVIKGLAMGALAQAGSFSDAEAATFMQKAGSVLVGASTDTVALQGTLGFAEEAADAAITRHTSREAALTILRNDLVSADSYETATELQQVQLQLETHYTLTARLAGLSLTDYL